MHEVTETCVGCGHRIQYETLAGTRIFKIVGAVRVYRSRCGCGDVARSTGAVDSARGMMPTNERMTNER